MSVCAKCQAELVRTSEQYLCCPYGHGKLVQANYINHNRIKWELNHVLKMVNLWLPRFVKAEAKAAKMPASLNLHLQGRKPFRYCLKREIARIRSEYAKRCRPDPNYLRLLEAEKEWAEKHGSRPKAERKRQ